MTPEERGRVWFLAHDPEKLEQAFVECALAAFNAGLKEGAAIADEQSRIHWEIIDGTSNMTKEMRDWHIARSNEAIEIAAAIRARLSQKEEK